MCLTHSFPSPLPLPPQLFQQRAERGRRSDQQILCLSVLRVCPCAVAGVGTRELKQCRTLTGLTGEAQADTEALKSHCSH